MAPSRPAEGSPPPRHPRLSGPRRLAPLKHPVTLTLDGEPIQAERGEPLAISLLAAGKWTIARSPKFHRPRGPSCLRGACDGCLTRVDGTPNVMTCLTPAEDGTSMVSQNRLGPRDADLLRMTDWFFPEGMNHHELFAGVPGIQSIMQGFARRVAGLGRLPARAPADRESAAPRPASRRAADVVVVGAGPSGMAMASRLAGQGRSVEVLDDQLEPGGGLTALAPEDAAAFASVQGAFDASVRSGRVRLRSRTTAGAVYGSRSRSRSSRDLLVVGAEGAEIVEARTLVLACGAHDGALAFEGNDLPGVMSARAAGWLLSRGVLVSDRVAVVVAPGGGPFGESFARAFQAVNDGEHAQISVLHGEPLAVGGRSRAKNVRVRVTDATGAPREHAVDADVVLVDAPRAPAYELCEQAGAEVVHEPRGFTVRTEPSGATTAGGARGGGRVAAGVWAVGEVTGTPFDARAFEEEADRVAASIQQLGS